MAAPEAGGLAVWSRLRSAQLAPRWRRVALWTAGLLAACLLFLWLAAPVLIKSALQDRLGEQLHRSVSVGQVEINPFRLSATIRGLSVRNAAGEEQAGFDELLANVSSASLFRWALVVDRIRLRGWRISVARLGEGKYDVSDLLDAALQPSAPDKPAGPPPRFSLNNIELLGGRISFDDRPRGTRHTVSDIDLTLPFVSSLPYQAEIVVQPHFSATVDGARLLLQGHGKPFSAQHQSELDLNLDRFDLARLQPYLPAALPLKIGAGVLDSRLKAVFSEAPDKVYSLVLHGGVAIDGLALADRQGQPLLAWKALAVDFGDSDPVNRKIVVNRVSLDGFDAALHVDAKGRLNVLDLLSGPKGGGAAKPGRAAAGEATPALRWSVGGIALSNGRIRWRDDSRPTSLSGEIGGLQATIGGFDSGLKTPIRLRDASCRIDFGDRLQADLRVKDGALDLAGHRVDIGEIAGHRIRALVRRDRAGQVDWLAAPALKSAKDERPASGAPWSARLGKLDVDDLALRFEDATTTPAAVQTLSGFGLHGENLATGAGAPGRLAFSGTLNTSGKLRADGTLRLQPFELALQTETRTLPVLPLQPYFAGRLNVALAGGQLSNRGKLTLRLGGEGLQAAYAGSATLGNFLAVDKVNSTDFLKWKSLYLGGVDFHLAPLSINLGEIALTDFYSRLILGANGRLNLQDMVKPAPGKGTANAAGGGQAGGGSKVEGERKAEGGPKAGGAMPPIRIAKVTLQNGTVNFSDFFVKPNYSVNMTRLGGRVTGLSSAAGSVADMELRGSYGGTAPVSISGRLNPLAAKAFLDLKGNIAGVDLTDFSPYSGKYAGYQIDKGKLSLDVAYHLENDQLKAENQLFIDQLTFGDRVDSPQATKLPVGLAIALLKNGRGEIRLNLPIAGSLEDPDFSIGGVVIKMIANLFVKAVTSPFTLLGSLIGSGEELSHVDFRPGLAALDDAARHKLEGLAKALAERPALKLEISGDADPAVDVEGLKRAAIKRAMQAEKLKDVLKKGGEGRSLDSIEIAPAEYETYLTRAYRAAKFPKPRNFIGFQKSLPVPEMEKLMLANLPAGDDDLRQLASRRAEAVQVWLVDQGKVAPERLFLVPSKKPAGDAHAARVEFSLR